MSNLRQNALSAAADCARASIRDGEPVLCVGGPKHHEFMHIPGRPGFFEVPTKAAISGNLVTYQYIYREFCRCGDGGIMFLGLFVGENVSLTDDAVIQDAVVYWYSRRNTR